jgi:hypothetical protein
MVIAEGRDDALAERQPMRWRGSYRAARWSPRDSGGVRYSGWPAVREPSWRKCLISPSVIWDTR